VIRRRPGLVALALCAAALAACAAEPGVGPMRVLVKLTKPGADAASIAVLASQTAQVPARYLAASSAQWHALSLDCTGVRECEAALVRLRAASGAFEAVERDERKRIVTP
jgi:hypothetical protein